MKQKNWGVGSTPGYLRSLLPRGDKDGPLGLWWPRRRDLGCPLGPACGCVGLVGPASQASRRGGADRVAVATLCPPVVLPRTARGGIVCAGRAPSQPESEPALTAILRSDNIQVSDVRASRRAQ